MRAKKKDTNHNEIAAEFERLDCYVLDLSAMGNGTPDMWIADFSKGISYFVEAKSKYGKRNPLQIAWAQNCPIPVYIMRDAAKVNDFVLKGIYDEPEAI